MSEVGIKRLDAGHCEENSADDDRGDAPMAGEKGEGMQGIDGQQHFGPMRHMPEAKPTERQEPQDHDRAKDAGHAAGAKALHGK